eukprot:TRINITY_DN5658_c0_g3_i16.p1 TRINITY_DN5658_c0_g3~~TRINITY_DN5658_c0_g3_i16.p1  ORF type:complete len:478 (+),score=134.67 TRINITY_DN5658_c0_g3_i16:179-1612(+)
MDNTEPLTTLEQTDSLQTSPTTSNESLSAKESLKELAKGWRGSVAIKIISLIFVVIVVLFVIFAITASKYAASKAACDKSVGEEKKRLAKCSRSLLTLRGEEEKLRGQVRDVSDEINRLKSRNSELGIKNTELERKIGEQNDKKRNLNETHSQLAAEEKQLDSDVSSLRSTKTERENELKKLKDEFGKVEKELAEKEEEKEKWTTGGTIAGGVNVLSLLSTGYFRWQLNVAQEDAEKAEAINRDLKGHISNAKKRVTLTKADVERIKKEIIAVNESINSCHSNIIIFKARLDTCLEDEAKLRERSKVMIELGLDQAIYHHLSHLNRTEITDHLLYDSNQNHFEYNKLKASLEGKESLLLVMASSSGHVFGVYIQARWDKGNNGFLKDKSAFTFSITHHRTCGIINSDIAIKFGGNYLFDIGDGEIRVEKSSLGMAKVMTHAGKNFNCIGVNPGEFYVGHGDLFIEGLKVYYLEVVHF